MPGKIRTAALSSAPGRRVQMRLGHPTAHGILAVVLTNDPGQTPFGANVVIP
ncbi:MULTISPECIES: hypothetical protein [unclassified Xanthobacter]|uniref:hypothetical protein n=1 Tax=unclassified Xanthobacter TaxID=2623496 RepID=UPI001EDDA95B|nr:MULTISPECIES: hypothetical protein [unclassified Xanthobacter]